jgi:hypothetical protein
MNNNPLFKLSIVLFLIVNTTALTASVKITGYRHTAGTDSAKKRIRTELIFPVPPHNENRLFYIQRDPNTNTLIYDINMDKSTGKPDADMPVHAYWIRYNDKGQKEELSYIQRKFAYGLVAKPIGNDRYDIRFVSYKKFPLTLMKATDGKYHIFATVSQKLIMLNKVFIKIEGGSFWLPNVIFVEMKGTDPVTGKEITERFKP